MNQELNNIKWKKTDPDNFQYGRKIAKGIFQFKEFNRIDYDIAVDEDSGFPTKQDYIDHHFDNDILWVEDTIDLSEYTEKEIREYVSGYYNSLEELKEIYGNDWEWIVAECIFEQTCGLY